MLQNIICKDQGGGTLGPDAGQEKQKNRYDMSELMAENQLGFPRKRKDAATERDPNQYSILF